MTGREFMHEIKHTRRRIRLLEEQILRNEIKAQGVGAIRYDKVSVQTSPVQDRLTDIVDNINSFKEQLKQEIILLQTQEKEAIEYLLKLSECHERVLSLHYLDGYTWSQVAVKLNYDDGYIYEVKDKALDELTKVLKESEKN